MVFFFFHFPVLAKMRFDVENKERLDKAQMNEALERFKRTGLFLLTFHIYLFFLGIWKPPEWFKGTLEDASFDVFFFFFFFNDINKFNLL
jgi:hypothetical protein